MRTPFAALAHAIGGILILGYSMEYYFHLRMAPLYPPFSAMKYKSNIFQVTTRTTPTKFLPASCWTWGICVYIVGLERIVEAEYL